MKHTPTRPERDKAKKNFYFMLLFTIVVSLFFHFLNIAGGGEYWAIYPILGLAFTTAMSGIKVFMNELESENERNEQLYLSELPQLRKEPVITDREPGNNVKKVSGEHTAWDDREFV